MEMIIILINFSNHNSDNWDTRQKTAAGVYGEIVDIPFPAVNADADEREISELADRYLGIIMEKAPEAVLVQGEMTLCYALVSRLRRAGIKTLCSTTERIANDEINQNGERVKKSIFRFVRFREYME